jgi:antitoxin ParD1/3/4
MTLHVNLSGNGGFIKSKVASGFYGNATEVIRDAIRRMQADDLRANAWRAAIKAGDDELDGGEGVEYTADALADITSAAIDSMHSGKPMDPDVLPEETRKVVLSPRVRQDFIDILRFTGEASGQRQLHILGMFREC